MDEMKAMDLIGCAQVAFLAVPLLREAGAQIKDFTGDEMLAVDAPLARIPYARLGSILRKSGVADGDQQVAHLADVLAFTGKPKPAEDVKRAAESLTALSRDPQRTRLRECLAEYRMERFSRTIHNIMAGRKDPYAPLGSLKFLDMKTFRDNCLYMADLVQKDSGRIAEPYLESLQKKARQIMQTPQEEKLVCCSFGFDIEETLPCKTRRFFLFSGDEEKGHILELHREQDGAIDCFQGVLSPDGNICRVESGRDVQVARTIPPAAPPEPDVEPATWAGR